MIRYRLVLGSSQHATDIDTYTDRAHELRIPRAWRSVQRAGACVSRAVVAGCWLLWVQAPGEAAGRHRQRERLAGADLDAETGGAREHRGGRLSAGRRAAGAESHRRAPGPIGVRRLEVKLAGRGPRGALRPSAALRACAWRLRWIKSSETRRAQMLLRRHRGRRRRRRRSSPERCSPPQQRLARARRRA